MRRLRQWLAGDDGPGRRSPPLGELLSPVPLAALVLLAVNDRVLKAHAPGWLTGKLSDLAGAIFFPLLLTSLVDTVLWLTPWRVDFSLRRAKLLAAVLGTGGFFTLLKLWPAWAAGFDALMRAVGIHARTVPDVTDLLVLPLLGVAWAIGAAEIRRVPHGRLEAIRRSYRGGGVEEVRAWLADTADDGRLAQATAAWLDAPGEDTAEAVRRALSALRSWPLW